PGPRVVIDPGTQIPAFLRHVIWRRVLLVQEWCHRAAGRLRYVEEKQDFFTHITAPVRFARSVGHQLGFTTAIQHCNPKQLLTARYLGPQWTASWSACAKDGGTAFTCPSQNKAFAWLLCLKHGRPNPL